MKIFSNFFCVRRSDFFHINNMLVTRSLHVIFPFARACFPLKRIDSRDYPCNLSTAFHLLLRVDRSFEDIPCSWWTRAANAFLWIIAPLTERWNREINFLPSRRKRLKTFTFWRCDHLTVIEEILMKRCVICKKVQDYTYDNACMKKVEL